MKLELFELTFDALVSVTYDETTGYEYEIEHLSCDGHDATFLLSSRLLYEVFLDAVIKTAKRESGYRWGKREAYADRYA
jgi:hypothetical protein